MSQSNRISPISIRIKKDAVSVLDAMRSNHPKTVDRRCTQYNKSIAKDIRGTSSNAPSLQFVQAHYLAKLKHLNNIKNIMQRAYQTLQIYRYLYFDINYQAKHYVIKNASSKGITRTNKIKAVYSFNKNRNSENDYTLLDTNYTSIPSVQVGQNSQANSLSMVILTYIPTKFLKQWDETITGRTNLIADKLSEIFTIYIITMNKALSDDNLFMIYYTIARSIDAIKSHIYIGLHGGVNYWSHKGIVRLKIHKTNFQTHTTHKIPALALNHGDLTPQEEVLMANRATYLSNVYGVLQYCHKRHVSLENECGAFIEIYISMFFDVIGKTKHFMFTKEMQSKYNDPFTAFNSERNSAHQYRFLDFNQGYCTTDTNQRLAGPLDIVTYTTNDIYEHRYDYYLKCLRNLRDN